MVEGVFAPAAGRGIPTSPDAGEQWCGEWKRRGPAKPKPKSAGLSGAAGGAGPERRRQPRAMLTARATITASVANDSRFSAAMTSFAVRVYGMASVGENAIELVSDT